MSTYVVAVSGGVDSVVLLDLLSNLGTHELIVAHVDHGIREDSGEDRRFVHALSRGYGHRFVSTSLMLGPDASEDQARRARYEFLRRTAADNAAKIVTAHHGDDVVESVAINLHRGTGWRGLATHDADIERPLLAYTKAQLHEYALKRGLEWREDSTNRDRRYLRNNLRQYAMSLPQETKHRLLALREEQRRLKREVALEVSRLIGSGPAYDRHFLIHVPSPVALECLRHITQARLTRPQMTRALLAIKTAKPGTVFEAGDSIRLSFTTRNFAVTLIK